MVKRLSLDARKLVLTSAADPRIQRRTNVARIFHGQVCLRLVTALAVETSEEWETGRRYPDMELLEEILGKLATMYAGGELGEGEYREARQIQLEKLEKAEERLEKAARRTEDLVRGDLLEDTWRDLGQMTSEQWRELSIQAQRDIYDLILDKVIVNPADKPPRLRVYWR